MVNLDQTGPNRVGTSACAPEPDGPATERPLTHRFPKPRFPATIGAVPAVLLAVMLIAAGALALLRTPPAPEVPVTAPAELDAAAAGAAAAFVAPADALVGSALAEQGALASGERNVLRRIANANPDVEGLAIADPRNGAIIADRGDDVPLPASLPLPTDGPRMTLADDTTVVAIPVSPDRVVVGSLTLRAPQSAGPSPQQRVLLTRTDGSIVAESSGRPDIPIPMAQDVAARAARGDDAFTVDDSKLVPRSATSAIALPGAADIPTDHVAAAAATPVPGVGASAGLIAMVVRDVPVVPGTSAHPGLVAAAAVAGGGLLAFVLLRALLVRPVRRLRDDVDVLARLHTGDTDRQPWIRRSRLRQADRIARAAVRLPSIPAGTRDMAPSSARRLTIGGTALLVLIGALVLMSLAGGFAAVGEQQQTRSHILVESSRATVDESAAALEATLSEGLAAVQAAASPTVGETESDWTVKVAALHTEQPALRSVYVRDAHRIVAAAGEARLAERIPTTPLAQLNQSGPEPIVTVAAPTHDGMFTVVGEFDPRTLNDTLRRAGVATAVVDSGARTVLGSEGYLSFSRLDDPVLRRAATGATATPTASVEKMGDSEELVAAQRIGRSEATAGLGWVMLQHRDVTTARYTVDPVGRAATVIVAVTALISLALLAWTYVTAVQPLQHLVGWLQSTADAPADRAAGPGPPPRYLDEVGSVMSGLNHCAKRR